MIAAGRAAARSRRFAAVGLVIVFGLARIDSAGPTHQTREVTMSQPSFRSAAAVVAALLFVGVPVRADDPKPAAPTAAGALTDADRAVLVDMFEQGRKETEELVARAEGDLFTKKPAPDRWSVAEVLEHIGISEQALFGMVQAALAGAPDPEAAQLLTAMPVADFAGTIKSREKRFQAPAELQPKGGKSRQELLDLYRAAHDASLEFVRTTQAAVASYTAPSPAGKMTVHHLLTLIAAHNLRHNQQIAEVLTQLATPAASAPAASR
jgi:hypothetical protein